MFKKLILVAVAGLCVNAGTITYSNFGPGQTYNTGAGFGVQGPTVGSSQAPGFVATVTGALSQVDLPLVYFQPTVATMSLTISLETTSNGLPSGTILESWTISPSSVTTTPQIFSLASVLNPTVTAGVQYWLVASTSDPSGYNWLVNSIGLFGNAYNYQGDGFQYQPASPTMTFDVVVGSAASGVPEPGSMGLVGVACVAMIGARWTRLRNARTLI